MAVRKRRKVSSSDKNKLNLYNEALKFYVQEDRKYAMAIVDYNRQTPDDSKTIQLRMRVISVWMDPISCNAVKAHLWVNPKNPGDMHLVADMRKCGMMNASGGFCFSTDGTLIRYGRVPTDTYEVYDTEADKRLRYFDSKAQAVTDILKHVARVQTVGGLNLVSFSKLPDSAMAEIGYEKMPDLMKRGIPMWRGNPVGALGVNDYGSEARKNRQQFLDLLGRTLNVEVKEPASGNSGE